MKRFDLSRAAQETRLPEGARLAMLEPDEHPAALRLLAEHGMPLDADALAAPSRAALGVFVAGALAGVAALSCPPGQISALLLRAMAVRASDRGRGLGLALVEATAGLTRALDVDVVGAECPVDAHAPQKWLERCGFRLFSIFPEPRGSPSGVRIAFRTRYVRVLVPAETIRWPLPDALTPRGAALLARLWGDPPSMDAP